MPWSAILFIAVGYTITELTMARWFFKIPSEQVFHTLVVLWMFILALAVYSVTPSLLPL